MTRLLALSLAMAGLFSAVVLFFAPWPREAWFGGDTWEYHSMGVNFARGHGLVTGLREPIEMYRFGNPENSPALLEHFIQAGQDLRPYNSYRTPVYPLFLGFTYRLTSPSPIRAAQVQVILLILVVFTFPLAGKWISGRRGFWAGG